MALSVSITLIVSSWRLMPFATMPPIWLAPRIISLLTSTLLLPRKVMMGSMPSRVVMMNTRSWYLNFIPASGMIVSSPLDTATMRKLCWSSFAPMAAENSVSVISRSGESSSSLKTAIRSLPRAKSIESVDAVRLRWSTISVAAILSG